MFFLLLPPGALLFEHFRGAIILKRYKAELARQGVKLSPAEMVSPTNGVAENGVPQLLSALETLRAGRVLPGEPPPAMAAVDSGRAVAGFREVDWGGRSDDSIHTNNWDLVAIDLETNAATLAEIREALRKPVLDNRPDFSQAPNMPMTNLGAAKKLALWLGGALQLALQDGRTADATEDLVSEVHVVRWLNSDQVVVGELVQIAITQIALNHFWEALQADGWTDAQLKTIQEAWQGQDMVNNAVRALEGELVFGEVCTRVARESNQAAYDMIFEMDQYLDLEDERPAWERLFTSMPYGDALVKFCKEQIYCRVWRFAWADQAECRYLEFMMRLIEISRQGAREKSRVAVNPALEALAADSDPKGWYDRLRFPGPSAFTPISRAISKAMQVETVKSLAIAALAIKRYSLAHGHPPPTLQDLVPAYLPAVPVDYMDGKALKYRTGSDGGFTLYSVGMDGHDDGGDSALISGKKKSRNRWDRKDYVWPAPATAAELEDYRRRVLED